MSLPARRKQQAFTPQELEEAAEGLSYFNDPNDPEMLSATGVDEMLDFAGSSIPTLIASTGDRVIKLNLDNNDTSNAARVLLHVGERDQELVRLKVLTVGTVPSATTFTGGALLEGDFYMRRNGLITDGSFAPLSPQPGQVNVTASSSGAQSIKNVLSYLRRHATPINAIDIVANQDTQMAQVFTIREISPFKEGETKYLDPTKATNQDTFQSRRAKFNTQGLVFDSHVEVEYTINPETNVTLTLFCGASMSQGRQMRNAVKNALMARRARGR